MRQESKGKVKNILFKDHEFPPNSKSLGNLPNREGVEWIRIPDLPHLNGSLTSKQTPYVFYFDGKNSRKRLKQGKIGNCWFCAVAANLSDYYEKWSRPIEVHGKSRFESKA